MSDQNNLQEIKEEAEFLRKRAWDFIGKQEKLEEELRKTTDADKRQALQTRLKNTRRLLDDYLVEYEALCKEAGLTPESFTPNAPSRDIVSTFSRKTEKTREDLLRGEKIDLPPFFLVPSRNPKFTGRQEEVREFIQRVLEGGAFTICGVKGMGGIGKSEIAKEVCHLLHQTWQPQAQLPEYVADFFSTTDGGLFRDGMLWIQFEPETQTPKSLTEWLLPKLLGAQAQDKIKDLDALAEALTGKDILVVLDSVEQNLRTFDYVLERFKGKFPLIITSRVAIPGIQARDINVLKDDEAEALFIAHLENPEVSDTQREIICELCRLQGNYPLIIRNTASLVDSNHSNLEALKTKYQENRTLLLEENAMGAEKRHAMVKTCFGISFDSLDEPEQRAFLHSALFNNPFTAEALAALLEAEDSNAIHHIVKRLAKFSLLNPLQGKDGQAPTYELHPLMREFALDLLLKDVQTVPGKKEEIAVLLGALKDAKKYQTLLERLQDRALVQQAMEAIEYCDQVFDFETVHELMNVLNDTLDSLGYWDEKTYLNQLAVRAAVALQNRSHEAFWHVSFSETLLRKAVSNAELKQAHQRLENALKIVKELKQSEQILYVQYLLGYIEGRLENWLYAVRVNFQGIRDACSYGGEHRLGRFLKNLSQIHYNFSTEAQIKLFSRLNFKAKTLAVWRNYNKEKYNLLRAYEDIVDIQYRQGQVKACIPRYKRQLQLAKTINNAGIFAESIENFFNCALYLQDPQVCTHYLQIYLNISTSLSLAESQRQDMIGCYAWLNGDYQAAIQAFSTAMGENDLKPQYYHYWLGKTYLYQGNLKQAETHLNQALEHHRADKNAVEMAQVYNQLALLALKRGNPRQAAETFVVAMKTQQARGIEISPEERQIEQDISAQLTGEEFEAIAAQAQAIDLQPDFILPELPHSHTAQDGKLMLLIPAGPVFIGKGEMEMPTTEELLDNIGHYLFPYRRHSDQYQVPEHPDSVFDEDQLLFLLEHSQAISGEDKQQLLTKVPEIPQDKINELLRGLQQEYDVTHPKATEIYLYPYYIDRDPVSNAEYAAFCTATEHSCPTHWAEGQFPPYAADLPVVNISLEDAKAYAAWADKELPTAAEWEKACRGEHGVVYPWGDEWDKNKVKAKNGVIRQQFDKEYESLNAAYPEDGGIVHFKTPRYDPKLFSKHPLTQFDETEFLNLVQGSISLNLNEKQKVVDAIETLSQYQINELFKVFREEKEKFQVFMQKHPDDIKKLRRKCYLELMQSDLEGHYLSALRNPVINESIYGVRDLAGSIYHLTITEKNGGSLFAIKGGSWFSENPQESCKAWTQEWLEPYGKRMYVGFRCVKPIFSREDLVGIMSPNR